MSNIVNAHINARFQFLTRDGDANTNKGAVFLYFIFLLKFCPQNNVVFISSKYEM